MTALDPLRRLAMTAAEIADLLSRARLNAAPPRKPVDYPRPLRSDIAARFIQRTGCSILAAEIEFGLTRDAIRKAQLRLGLGEPKRQYAPREPVCETAGSPVGDNRGPRETQEGADTPGQGTSDRAVTSRNDLDLAAGNVENPHRGPSMNARSVDPPSHPCRCSEALA